MRYNNKSNLLESVFFPSLGWIYNLDLNSSSTLDPNNNPLKMIRGSETSTKLHIFVGTDLTPTPVFPANPTNTIIIDDNQRGFVLDSVVRMCWLR
jgi:hypothetical protein